MPPIVTFIGWHDSGKTTLASRVVHHLHKLGYQVAVIKSTKDSGISFDHPGTDTHTHRSAGADSVMLVAPDQMVILTSNKGESLGTLAHRHFPDVDIVIGEGFKEARQVAKIEVFRSDSATPPPPRLRGEVTGVIAVASDDAVTGDHIFRLSEAAEIASFIEKRFLHDTAKGAEHTSLLINGDRVPMKGFVQDALAGTVHGFVESLKLSNKGCKSIDIHITLHEKQ